MSAFHLTLTPALSVAFSPFPNPINTQEIYRQESHLTPRGYTDQKGPVTPECDYSHLYPQKIPTTVMKQDDERKRIWSSEKPEFFATLQPEEGMYSITLST